MNRRRERMVISEKSYGSQKPLVGRRSYHATTEMLVDRIQHLVPTPDGGDDSVRVGGLGERLRLGVGETLIPTN